MADLQDHPEDLVHFFDKLEAGYDVVLPDQPRPQRCSGAVNNTL